MLFENVAVKYVAVEIAVKEYEAEYLKCPQLIRKDIRNEVRGLITAIFEQGFKYKSNHASERNKWL